MSDYRDPYTRDPMDPTRDPMDPTADPTLRDSPRRTNSGLGWIAGAVFLAIVLALIFGLGRTGDQTASTGSSPPAATTGAAPTGGPMAPRTTTGQSSSQ